MKTRKKSSSGMSLAVVIIFITLMSLVAVAMLITASAAMRSARILPAADGHFYSAEAAMNRALPMIVSDLMSTPDMNTIANHIRAASVTAVSVSPTALHPNATAAQVRFRLESCPTPAGIQFRETVALHMRNFVQDAPNIDIPDRFPHTAAPALGQEGSEHFLFATAIGVTFEAPVGGFASPAFVNLRRLSATDSDLHVGVLAEVTPYPADRYYPDDRCPTTVTAPFTVTLIPYITVISEAGTTTLMERIALPISSFTLRLDDFETGNGAAYGDLDGNDPYNPGYEIEILKQAPINVTSDSDNWTGCPRQSAYNVMRDGIQQMLDSSPPTLEYMFSTAYPDMPSGNQVFLSYEEEWVSIPSDPTMDQLRPILENENVRYVNITSGNNLFNDGLSGTIYAPHLAAIHIGIPQMRIREGTVFTGENTILRAGNNLQFVYSGGDGSNTITLNGIQIHAGHMEFLNNANGRLNGNAVYVQHNAGTLLNFGGSNFIIGDRGSAPQFFTRQLIQFGANSRFYGILGTTSYQLNTNMNNVTLTGMIVANMFYSTEGVYDVDQGVATINGRINPSPYYYTLALPCAVDDTTHFMVSIRDYLSSGTGDTWQITGSAAQFDQGSIGILR